MSDTFQLKTPERRQELHHCECGARFEVGHHGDVQETTTTVDVSCPRCGRTRAVTVPQDTERDLVVELLPDPEAEDEDGGGGGGD